MDKQTAIRETIAELLNDREVAATEEEYITLSLVIAKLEKKLA